MRFLSVLMLISLLFVCSCSILRPLPSLKKFSQEDEALLEEVEHASFLYFWNEANPESGLVRDKTGVDVCSVASQGFGLAALAVGTERGYVPYRDAEDRALRSLRILNLSNAKHEGMFCHFIDLETGNATTGGYESGSSTIDTALLIAGAVVAGEYFGGEVKELAEKLYAEVNWKAYLDPENKQVYMTWIPDEWGEMDSPGKFDPQTWDWYSDETLLIALLGIAAPNPEYRLEEEQLTNWVRKEGSLGDLEYVYSWPGTLFTYIFAHCYYDFSRMGIDPGGTDWHFNTDMAVRANRDWCRSQSDKFSTYGFNRWGITAGSGPGGSYVVPGHQPRGASGNDPAGGTLHPYGAGMSVPYVPEDAINALRHMRYLKVGDQPVWKDPSEGGYGFMDGFNIDEEWVSEEVIGIAQGPMLLMIENARTGMIHDLFMGNEWIEEGLKRSGFSNVAYPAMSNKDEKYLRKLAEDTWDCIAYFVNPETGLPYDTSNGPEHSSVTNLGYYVACCTVAHEMGFVSRREAVTRIRKVLDSFEQFDKWKGWSQSWNNIETLEPSSDDRMVSVLDSGNMVAGFAMAEVVFPEVAGQVRDILSEMDWSAVYDEEAELLYGGYDMKKQEIAENWHIGDYAGDGRMAAFWAIAVGAASLESWENLNRETETHFGLTFFKPAWLGGGLFMQVQDGLFLDERFTPAGKSAADFAYAQMLYAESLELPAWGWSASWSPDNRYLGWGGLEVPVVTPHAAGMTSQYYPHKAAECLQVLEEMGAREPFVIDGKSYEFGFRDSINLETGDVSDLYLPSLDQPMMFLAMANILEDGLVHRIFESHPTVKRGIELIDEYQWPEDEAWLAELKSRDQNPLPSPADEIAEGPCPILVDDFEDDTLSPNRLGAIIDTWTKDPGDDTMSVDLSLEETSRNDKETKVMKIDYDVESPNPAFGGVTIGLGGINASGCDALSMWVKGNPDNIKTELHGRGGIGVTRIQKVNKDAWTEIKIPLLRFGGMITDYSSMDKIVLVFEDSASKPKQGTLYLDDIEFVKSRE